MHRSVVLVAMIFAMLWQSVALARVGSTVNVLTDLEHAALHWQGEGHHHHDDGSYHPDDSKESAQHVVTDHVSASLAMAMASPASHHFPALGSAAFSGVHPTAAPDPALDGLLRPPRARF